MSPILPDYRLEAPAIVSHRHEVDPQTLREIQRTLSKRVHGVFASRKNRKPIPWRNRDEHRLFGLLEIDPNVASFEAMPEKVSFFLGGKMRTHVPTARVVAKSGTAILDVARPTGSLSDAIEAVYATRGVAYRAVASQALHALPRADNADWVLSHRGYVPDQGDIRLVTYLLSNSPSYTVAGLERVAGYSGIAATACAMALDGQLDLDLAAPTPMEMRAALFAGARR